MDVAERFKTSTRAPIHEADAFPWPIRRFRAHSIPDPADVAITGDGFVSLARPYSSDGVEGFRDVAIRTFTNKVPGDDIFFASQPEGGTGATYKTHPVIWMEIGGASDEWMYGRVINDWLPGDTYLLVRPCKSLVDSTETGLITDPDTQVNIEFDPTDVSKVGMPGWCTWGIANTIVPYIKLKSVGIFVLVANPVPNDAVSHPPIAAGAVFQNTGSAAAPNCKWQTFRLY